jgi:hypothetical protein
VDADALADQPIGGELVRAGVAEPWKPLKRDQERAAVFETDDQLAVLDIDG